MKPPYVLQNDIERQRLDSLAARLTDDHLRLRLSNGLTVAAVFAHLAFWDDYCRALLEQWRQTGFVPSRTNFDAVNAAIRTVAFAVPVRLAVDLAQTAAAAVDRQVEALPAGLAVTIEAEGYSRMLERAAHRRQHLDQIERALADVDTQATQT